MSAEIIRKEKLKYKEVDVLSEKIDSFLQQNISDKMTQVGLRLSMEDLILHICDNLGEETSYELIFGESFKRPYIRFCYEGTAYDPRRDTSEPPYNWSRRIMSDMGLSPTWNYSNGQNILELRLKRKSIGSLEAIVIALVLSLVLGFGGALVFPAGFRETFCTILFKPLQSLFLGLLSVFAGIMILISVTCGIFNMGDTTSFNRAGKLMFRRFLVFLFLLASVDTIICLFIFPTSFGVNSVKFDSLSISEILQMIFGIIPSDPITPFLSGNVMQIVFLSIIIGIAILILGEKTVHVRSLAEEINTLVSGILSWVCRFLPFYFFFIMIDLIWSGEIKKMSGVWKPFLVMVCISLVVLGLGLIRISIQYKVSVSTLIRNLLPSFMICLTSASTISAYGQTVEDLEGKFGISRSYVDVALPIRSVIFKPGIVTEFIVMIYFTAEIYGVEVSIPWMILGILVCIILSIAVPPLPGSVAMVYGIVFTQMGIPMEAMAFAIACDVFYDFPDTAITNTIGMLELTVQADKLDMLDKDILRTKV